MSQIEALERQADGAKTQIEFRKMAMRLAQNRDFKKLIMTEFCVNECARYAQNSANPALGELERADSLAISQAAGHLKRWLSVTMQMGFQAEHELPAIEQAIEDARNEEEGELVAEAGEGDDN